MCSLCLWSSEAEDPGRAAIHFVTATQAGWLESHSHVTRTMENLPQTVITQLLHSSPYRASLGLGLHMLDPITFPTLLGL